jgi:ubiquinone/menaquinone biosynthesis C-methylase UbiE
LNPNPLFAYDLPSRVAAYDADMAIMHPNREKMVDIALEAPPIAPDLPFLALELGTGTGYFTRRFLERYPRSRVIAIDVAPSMVEMARARLGPLGDRVDFRVGDFRRMGELLSGHERGLVVFSSYSLHHLDIVEKADVIRQSLAFLQPDGWFLNADLVISESPVVERRIQELRVEGIVRRAGGRDSRFGDAASARRFLDEVEARDADQPVTLAVDLRIMKEAGLADVSAFWQEYREAVSGGRRPA